MAEESLRACVIVPKGQKKGGIQWMSRAPDRK